MSFGLGQRHVHAGHITQVAMLKAMPSAQECGWAGRYVSADIRHAVVHPDPPGCGDGHHGAGQPPDAAAAGGSRRHWRGQLRVRHPHSSSIRPHPGLLQGGCEWHTSGQHGTKHMTALSLGLLARAARPTDIQCYAS